jgi:site-specific recombinase XerD
MEFLIYALSKLHSPEVAKQIAKAHRTSTTNQYQSAWKTFQKWLKDTGCNGITNSTVLAFLNYCAVRLLLMPKTIMVYRNALAHPLRFAFGVDTKIMEFHLLARAQFLAKPPTAKRVPEWSLAKVLNLLGSETYLKSKEVIILLQRALFLVALATANRVSELAHLYRPGVAFSEHKNKVNLPVDTDFLYKNQRPNRTPQAISVKALKDKEGKRMQLCPVKALDKYLQATNHHNSPRVFLNPVTGRPLTAGTVAVNLVRLIKTVNPNIGVQAHDVRKVSTSLAWARGLDLDDLIKAANWSSTGIFLRHYLHPPRTEDAKGVECVALTTSR